MHNKPPRKYGKCEIGEFVNYNKYHGIKPIYFRSRLERISMNRCCADPTVKQWSSEPFGIYYIKPDGQLGTYYIDLVTLQTDGTTLLIEVKARKELQEGTKDWFVNKAKWQACIKYAESETSNGRKTKFVIWDETTLKSWGYK